MAGMSGILFILFLKVEGIIYKIVRLLLQFWSLLSCIFKSRRIASCSCKLICLRNHFQPYFQPYFQLSTFVIMTLKTCPPDGYTTSAHAGRSLQAYFNRLSMVLCYISR